MSKTEQEFIKELRLMILNKSDKDLNYSIECTNNIEGMPLTFNKRYIKVVTYYFDKQVIEYYELNNIKPILSEVRFIKEEGYYLSFVKENTSNNSMANFKINLVEDNKIKYSKTVKSLLNLDTEDLKPFTINSYNDEIDKNNKNNYFIENGNLTYTLHEEIKEADETYGNVVGACFEKVPFNEDNIQYKFNTAIKFSEKTLFENYNISAMIFNGSVNCDGVNIFPSLEIYKNKESIIIIYSSSDKTQSLLANTFKPKRNKNKDKKVPLLPIMSSGCITNEEINIIVEYLSKNYNNEFIDVACSKLLEFGEKLELKDSTIWQADQLTPAYFLNKSNDEIIETIEKNKDYYYELIENQYNSFVNIQKEKTKILKNN